MGKLIIPVLLALSTFSFAEVIDLKNLPVRAVIDVYEEEEQPSPNHGWIHNFETVPLGKEMDHLAKMKAGKEEVLTE